MEVLTLVELLPLAQRKLDNYVSREIESLQQAIKIVRENLRNVFQAVGDNRDELITMANQKVAKFFNDIFEYLRSWLNSETLNVSVMNESLLEIDKSLENDLTKLENLFNSKAIQNIKNKRLISFFTNCRKYIADAYNGLRVFKDRLNIFRPTIESGVRIYSEIKNDIVAIRKITELKNVNNSTIDFLNEIQDILTNGRSKPLEISNVDRSWESLAKAEDYVFKCSIDINDIFSEIHHHLQVTNSSLDFNGNPEFLELFSCNDSQQVISQWIVSNKNVEVILSDLVDVLKQASLQPQNQDLKVIIEPLLQYDWELFVAYFKDWIRLQHLKNNHDNMINMQIESDAHKELVVMEENFDLLKVKWMEHHEFINCWKSNVETVKGLEKHIQEIVLNELDWEVKIVDPLISDYCRDISTNLGTDLIEFGSKLLKISN